MISRPYIFIDGFNIFMRYLMVTQQTSSVGEPCGGVLGFLKAIKWLNRRLTPARIYVVWESGGGSLRRKAMYPEYKANRGKTKFNDANLKNKEAIIPNLETKAKQLQILAKAMGFLPICQIFVQDAEADDVIAYLVKRKFADKGIQKIIVSSDKDFYQLINSSTSMYDPARKIIIDVDYIKAMFELAPENFALARAVVGDPSDNITGVEGIGLKTMAKRFKMLSEANDDYNVNYIVEAAKAEANRPGKVLKCYQAIAESKDIIHRNWQLMYLDTNSLSANQINKINYRVGGYIPSTDKLEYLRTFINEDIAVSQDLEQLTLELRVLLINS